MKRTLLPTLLISLSLAVPAVAQQTTSDPLTSLAELPGVSGYEEKVTAWLAERLEAFSPEVDNLGNVVITLGAGAPHRLLVASIDEPGYVVSAITDDGFLRVQRLPQRGLHPWFDLLHSAQPVQVLTRNGSLVPGVVAGLSTHLHRDVPPTGRTDSPERMFIDVGARSADEVRELGIDVLDPITLEKHAYGLANGEVTAPFIGDRAGAVALVDLLESIHASQLEGSLTLAFVVRSYMGNQGLDRLLNQVDPDEVIFVQRLDSSHARPGAGVLVSAFERGEIGLATELLAVARENQIPVRAEFPETPPRGRYSGPLPLPARTALLSVPVVFPQTPGAIVSTKELSSLVDLVASFLEVKPEERAPTSTAGSGMKDELRGRPPTTEAILVELIKVYGVSGFEEPVVEKIYQFIPDWAKEWAFLDAAGNFIVPFGRPGDNPSLVFVAHTDEIGWLVDEIMDNGRLRLRNRGGYLPEHFLGHALYIHTADAKVPAVLELPPNYHAEPYAGRAGVSYTAYTGARTHEEAEALGIAVGDSLTVPKQFRQLAGARVSARSFDDRVGSTALVAALWDINPKTIDREVIFVWAVREEIGLEGAKHFAARAAETGGVPDYVFAVDTFVSADSPLESPRYADGILGKGFVLRAVDHSNITPRPVVDCVVRLANERGIPVQYGVTGGGNDGAAFVPYGSIDIPIGWPLRYSHSAGEVADLRDVEALAGIVAALAQEGPECVHTFTGGNP